SDLRDCTSDKPPRCFAVRLSYKYQLRVGQPQPLVQQGELAVDDSAAGDEERDHGHEVKAVLVIARQDANDPRYEDHFEQDSDCVAEFAAGVFLGVERDPGQEKVDRDVHDRQDENENAGIHKLPLRSLSFAKSTLLSHAT